MIKINLLPWRPQRLRRRQRVFIVHCALVLVAVVLFVAVQGHLIDVKTGEQLGRLHLLERHYARLQTRVLEREALQQEAQVLALQLQKVHSLQANRAILVRTLSALAEAPVGNMIYTGLQRIGSSLSLEGVAENNGQVAELIRRLQQVPWLTDVRLSKIDDRDTAQLIAKVFALSLSQVALAPRTQHPTLKTAPAQGVTPGVE